MGIIGYCIVCLSEVANALKALQSFLSAVVRIRCIYRIGKGSSDKHSSCSRSWCIVFDPKVNFSLAKISRLVQWLNLPNVLGASATIFLSTKNRSFRSFKTYNFWMDPSAVVDGPDAIRTHDLRHVKATSFQLDYGPLCLL